MKKVIELSWGQVSVFAQDLAESIERLALSKFNQHPRIYGVPRGGIYVALLIKELSTSRLTSHLVDAPEQANVFVDDLIDSGATREAYAKKFPRVPFLTLIPEADPVVNWYVFPWERMVAEQGPEENVRRIIQYIGDDPKRSGLIETPERVVKSWRELFSGYNQNAKEILKTFDEPCDEMVVLKDIEFYSTCEHHMLPFTGTASIGYVANGRVVGISKLARLLEMYARRLQIQERIGQQITDTLMDVLKPKGAACILRARHFCMTCRGVGKQDSIMCTSSLRGVFTKPEVRAEFLQLAGI